MPIPYFSQFETPGIIDAYTRSGPEAALRTDPLWAASGARDQGEYVRWAGHVCGMACLKMVLKSRTGVDHQILDLARRCTRFGGYVDDPETGAINGLIYRPFIDWIASDFAVEARIATDLGPADLPDTLRDGALVMASVHPFIRSGRIPPQKGGHLVLVTAATPAAITFHNPSGHTPHTRENASLTPKAFSRYFAGRGIVILP